MLNACSNQNKNNPFFSEIEFPTEKVESKYYKPAFKEALKQHNAEIKKIAEEKQLANYANTVIALDNSGKMLKRVSISFEYEKIAEDSNLIRIQKWVHPELEKHEKEILKNDKLALRIKAVYDANTTTKNCPPNRVCEVIKGIYSIKPENLTEEQMNRLTHYYLLFFPQDTIKP